MLTSKGLRQQLEQLGVTPGAHLLVAVSGGADSFSLLAMCAVLAKSGWLRLSAVHINHKLRPESEQEEQDVREYCTAQNIKLTVRTWPVANHPMTGVEAAARTFRYQQFAEVATADQVDALLTAHHRDDQAETVLFRLLRSGNADAAAGIAPRSSRNGLTILRPLLNVTRSDIRAYAQNHQLPFSDDASNDDVRYSRNFLRHEILPTLEERFPDASGHLADFAEQQRGLKSLADMTLASLVPKLGLKSDVFDWSESQTYSYAVQVLVMRAALQRWVPSVSTKQVHAVLAAVRIGDGKRRLVALTAGHVIAIRGCHVQLVAADDEQTSQTSLPPYLLVTSTLVAGDLVLCNLADSDGLVVRTRQPGDRVQLTNGHHQLLRRLFINAHVPQEHRAEINVLARDNEILWIDDSRLNQLLKQVSTDKIRAYLVQRRRVSPGRQKRNEQ
ncbi:tRNA lysidine(34) synthetase TilS [Lacticaseibacillus pabuli]|uniref:tRNA(Ile)-lysidine synthase n=1 Tax=Lacticaseibacillus pabuli TaxID=3025672 RepID=A0ABY7WS89_9LACO|nr:tRNA lysidine(34) synthetase TilS [Lacticaseibacillus sp. KACC 23028]WDF83055.1 tRNA lysidine(34) synthetase TilS [Lacticaseibacillus sp. KACC 23028]